MLTPFLVGAILAYLGTPLVDGREKRRVSRALATTIVVLLFGVLLLVLFLVLVPLVQAEVVLAAKRLPELFGPGVTARSRRGWRRRSASRSRSTSTSLKTLVTDNLESARDLSLHLLAGVKTGGLILVSILVNLALIPVVMFYLLRDWNMIVERIDDLVPRAGCPRCRRSCPRSTTCSPSSCAASCWSCSCSRSTTRSALTLAGPRSRVADRRADRTSGVHSVRRLRPRPHARHARGAAAMDGLPGFFAVLAVYGIGQLLETTC